MKRLKIKDLRLTIFFLLFFLFINHQSFVINHVLAVDATPSSDIKAKLEELKTEIASKAALLKQEVNKKLQNKAYIGKVKTKSENTLTLATKNGPRIVNINQDTVFESKIKGKKYSSKLISEEDYLASLGDVDETGVLTAKKIVLLPNPASWVKTYLWGQIIAISDKLVTIKGKESKNTPASIPNLSKISTGDFLILTGNINKNDIFEAEFEYVKTATPSAKP